MGWSSRLLPWRNTAVCRAQTIIRRQNIRRKTKLGIRSSTNRPLLKNKASEQNSTISHPDRNLSCTRKLVGTRTPRSIILSKPAVQNQPGRTRASRPIRRTLDGIPKRQQKNHTRNILISERIIYRNFVRSDSIAKSTISLR